MSFASKGPGVADTSLFANGPAVGHDWQETTLQMSGGVAALSTVRLQAITFSFTASATVANRLTVFKITLPNGGQIWLGSPTTITASQVAFFTLGVGLALSTTTVGSDVAITLPIPDICFAQSPTAAASVQTVTSGIQTTDQWGALAGYASQGR